MNNYGHGETEIRTPLKVIQMLTGDNNQWTSMSTSRKSALTNRSNVPRQNRYSRVIETNRDPLVSKQTDVVSATKSSLLSKSKNCDKISSIARTTRVASPSRNASGDKPIKNVQSLTSSPKWSRIKDKFEANNEVENNLSRCPEESNSKYQSSKTTYRRGMDQLHNGTIAKSPQTSKTTVTAGKTTIRGRTLKQDIKPTLVDKLASSTTFSKKQSNVKVTPKSTATNEVPVTSVKSCISKNSTSSACTSSFLHKPSSLGYTTKNAHSRKYCSSINTVCNEIGDSASSLPISKNEPQINKLNNSPESKSLVDRTDEIDRPSSLCQTIKNNAFSNNAINIPSSMSKVSDLKLNLNPSTVEHSKDVKTKLVLRNEENTVTSHTNRVLPSHLKEKDNKNLWVKDEFGSWIKRPGKTSPESPQSNVAHLRNRYSWKLNEGESSHLKKSSVWKSQTDSNVPQKCASENSNKLLKSSTVGATSISSQGSEYGTCDTKPEICRSRVTSNSSSASDSSEWNSTSSEDHPGRNRKLSAVQRAVLSYEENLSLLSPETQRKLRLLGEKVKSQNAEDALIMNKNTIFSLNGVNNNDPKSKDADKKLDVKKFGEPVQPVRNFLNRYQNMNRSRAVDSKEDSNDASRLFSKNEKTNSVAATPKSDHGVKSDSISHSSKGSSVNVSELAKHFVAQGSSNDPKKTNDKSSSRMPVPNGKSLTPNSSFLWRSSKKDCSSLNIKNAEAGSSYYVLENYYTEADNNQSVVDKREQGNTSPKLTGGEARYQNVDQTGKWKKDKVGDDGWTDLSDDDPNCRSTSSKSSTLKKRKNRNSNYKGNLQRSWSQSFRDMTNIAQEQNGRSTNGHDNDQDDMENPGYGDYPDHLYEPVYESLGDYLISDDNNEQEIQSLSPDDEQAKDIYSSFTSLESLHGDKVANKESKEREKVESVTSEASIGIGKKATSKIRQLRRHLSWSKSDIKLELSSKFNKIKIKKNGNNDTEIGVRVQENGTTSTSPKKNTFIKCILKQKSCNNIPVKKTPSPKKESALFYVHLSMTREKQRPFSESCLGSVGPRAGNKDQSSQDSKKISDPVLITSQVPLGRPRRRSSGQVIQRPTTAPPLPPTAALSKSRNNSSSQQENTSSAGETLNKENGLYSECKIALSAINGSSGQSPVLRSLKKGVDNFCSPGDVNTKGSNSLYATIDSVSRKRNSIASSASYDSYAMADESGSSGASSSTTYSSGFTLHIESDLGPFYSTSQNLHLPLIKDNSNELLKSPFEEEPLYQFYHKDVQQRATLWYSADGSESEFDDYCMEKPIVSKEASPSKPPLLQTQTSAMDLIHGQHGIRTLWCEVPEVKNSHILESITPHDRKIQEAMFEVITSEASYLKSLNFLLEHFVNCPEFCRNSSEKPILDKRERHILFSDVPPVRDVSASLLADLEKRWLENIVLSNVCDIIYNHASKYFSVYVKYCSNQIYQDRTLKKMKENRPQFVEILKGLESNVVCQGLDMHSFLMLPMQRITRLPLLIDAIFHRLDINSPIYESCKMALALLNKLVAECNEGARKMERMEEMLVISHHLDFRDCKGLGLLSASRWLVKKGELVQLVADTNNKRPFGRNQRWCKNKLFLFLFTDLLVVTEKKSDDSYCVVDYCLRNMVQVMLVDENLPSLPSRLPSGYRNVFQLIMLSNREGKTVEMLLSCLLESDRTRWINAVTPPKSENPDEKIYEEWDCPQVQCTHVYVAQQPDEVSIEEADVLNVFRKMSDGWYEGERIRDGTRGWFPSSHTMEIANSHVRARNLRQRYRLLMLSQTYLEEQQKAQSAQVKGK